MPYRHPRTWSNAVRFVESDQEQCPTVMPGLDPGGAAKRFRGQSPWNGCVGIHGVLASPANLVESQSSPRIARRHQPNSVDARVKHTAVRFTKSDKEQCLTVMPGLDPGIHGVPASPAQPVKSQSSPRTDRRHQPNPVDARVKHTAVRFDETHKEQCFTVMPGLDPGIHGVPASPAQPVKSQSSPRTDRRHQPNPVDARVKHGHDDKVYFLTNNNANRTAVCQAQA